MGVVWVSVEGGGILGNDRVVVPMWWCCVWAIHSSHVDLLYDLVQHHLVVVVNPGLLQLSLYVVVVVIHELLVCLRHEVLVVGS